MKQRTAMRRRVPSNRVRIAPAAGRRIQQATGFGGGIWKNLLGLWGLFQTCRRFWAACKKWWGPLSGFLFPRGA